MSRPPTAFPSRDEGQRLHQRLSANDATVTADIVARYLPPLIGSLARWSRPADEGLIEAAAFQALCDYLRHPERFDPTRLDLGAYLRMAARADLRNELRRERRHHRRRIAWNVVEVGESAGNLSGREEQPGQRMEREEAMAHAWVGLADVVAALSDQERQVLELMRRGERATEAFAHVLKLDGLVALEQEREVKRVKDRIVKRLKRGRSAS
jgi:RNA polymerase sigma-70 factor (ECF subfamily)